MVEDSGSQRPHLPFLNYISHNSMFSIANMAALYAPSSIAYLLAFDLPVKKKKKQQTNVWKSIPGLHSYFYVLNSKLHCCTELLFDVFYECQN